MYRSSSSYDDIGVMDISPLKERDSTPNNLQKARCRNFVDVHMLSGVCL